MMRRGTFIFFIIAGCLTIAPALRADEGPPPVITGTETGSEAVSENEPETGTETGVSVRLSGSIRTDYFSSSRSLDDERDFTGATLQVKALPRFGEVIDGKIEARAGDTDIGRTGGDDAQLIEGYATARTEMFSVSAGKQIVKWGRADSVNPTDNLSPREYTLLLPLEEDQRLGTVGIRTDWYTAPDQTLILFWTPYFEPSTVPLPVPPGAVLRERTPAHSVENSVIGIKYDRTGGQFDWSISYVHGYSLVPQLAAGSIFPGSPVFDLVYPKMNVIGGDAARNFGSFGLRAEAAYIIFEDDDPQDEDGVHPYIYYVFGIDRTFLENLNINVQLVGRYVRDYRDPDRFPDPVGRELAMQNAITFGQLKRSNYGMTARIGDKWLNDTLEAELLAFVNFNPLNRYLRALVLYALSDRWKGMAGSEIYAGPQESYFGRLGRNQGVFAELRYSF